MLIYNQRPHRSLSNSTPTEVHHSDHDTFDTFLKQYSNETTVNKNSMLVILFELIEQLMFLKRGITCGPLNFLKWQKF